MKKLQSITGFFLSCVILLTHFVVLFHTLQHQDHHEIHQYSNDISHTDQLLQNSEIDEDCSICEIYVDVDFKEDKILNSEFSHTEFFNNKVSQRKNSFTSLVLYSKQSRSPPLHTI
ncbi:hypothetical protein [uncultured Tenacibaculum sp.]|uniref:hypothetical protein n=1 Tax=uncultured Tenacibaculum sp. TaxID=174713 RepID=UPI00262DB3D5|nr:hypothetical protein [uncultured Tenacibaculum sp.]